MNKSETLNGVLSLAEKIARQLNEHGMLAIRETNGDSIDPITVIKNTLKEQEPAVAAQGQKGAPGLSPQMRKKMGLSPGVAPAQSQPDIEALAREIDDFYFVGTPEEKRLSAIRAILSRRASDPQKGQGWVSVEDGLPDEDSDVYAAIPWTHTPTGERKYVIHDCSYYEGGTGSRQKIFTDCEGEEFEAHEVGFWIYKYRLAEQLPAPPSVPAGPQEEKKSVTKLEKET